MSIIDKLSDKVSRTLGLSENENEYEDEVEKASEEKIQTSKTETKAETPSPQPTPEPKTTHNILDFNLAAATKNENTSPRFSKMVKTEIKTIKPQKFNDAQTVANTLREKVAVLVNFEETDMDEAKRILDFISGTIYAIDGKIRKVGEKVFICAPDNVILTSSEDDKKSNIPLNY